MKFLVDENLSSGLCSVLHELGYDATSLRNRGRLGLNDPQVLELAIDEDRVIITANGDDFRQLVGQVELHPGLVVLPNAALGPATERLMMIVEFVRDQPEGAADYMVNRVISASAGGALTVVDLPPASSHG